MTVFLVWFLSVLLQRNLITSFLLFSQTPVTTWVKGAFYFVLVLTTIGFSIVVGLQIKSFFTKDPTINKERTWESIWTIVPLIVLIALWWFF